MIKRINKIKETQWTSLKQTMMKMINKLTKKRNHWDREKYILADDDEN